ncbi:hypothetical protein [Comamonas sp. JUb58]|uniref:hypothetical protein n=1 Tax=Comamonas sp. JUb58 TaxID=2485114 RepID=UPI001060F53D|nr:hypothetical protein [Comamonas sp. JUb58]
MDAKFGEHEVAALDAAAAWQQALPVVEQVWEGVFDTTNKMLKVHADFGFELFEKKMNPKIETVLFALNVLEQILDAMYTSSELTPDETRMVLNARQQILLVQRVAEALKANCKDDYLVAMEQIAKQPVI